MTKPKQENSFTSWVWAHLHGASIYFVMAVFDIKSEMWNGEMYSASDWSKTNPSKLRAQCAQRKRGQMDSTTRIGTHTQCLNRKRKVFLCCALGHLLLLFFWSHMNTLWYTHNNAARTEWYENNWFPFCDKIFVRHQLWVRAISLVFSFLFSDKRRFFLSSISIWNVYPIGHFAVRKRLRMVFLRISLLSSSFIWFFLYWFSFALFFNSFLLSLWSNFVYFMLLNSIPCRYALKSRSKFVHKSGPMNIVPLYHCTATTIRRFDIRSNNLNCLRFDLIDIFFERNVVVQTLLNANQLW